MASSARTAAATRATVAGAAG